MLLNGRLWANLNENFTLLSNVMCSYVDVDVDVYKEKKNFIPKSSKHISGGNGGGNGGEDGTS